MKRTSLRIGFTFLAFGAGIAGAEDKSYIQLVSELVGSVESPRIVRDYCASVAPSSAAYNASLYDKWRQRHWTLLQAVDQQRSRADVRLKRLGNQGDHPTDALYNATKAKLFERFNDFQQPERSALCGNYAQFIQKMDEKAKTDIPKLLGDVAAADAALTAREKK